MKKREWVNPNRMKIDTMHKKFNQQTNFIGPGQVVSDTQFSIENGNVHILFIY